MKRPKSDVAARAALGLPYENKQVVRRVLMHVPWRMFLGRQVAFNESVVSELAAMSAVLERLERRVDRLADSISDGPGDSAARAVREQLYDTEGSLRHDLSQLRIELARVAKSTRRQ